MKKTLLITIIVCISAMLLNNGCRKEKSVTTELIPEQEELSTALDAIKSKFDFGNYQSRLNTKLNDTSILNFQPVWDNSASITVGDSVTFYYTMLSASIKNERTKTESKKIFFQGVQNYLITKKTNKGLEFSIGKYLAVNKDLKQIQERNTVSTTNTSTSTLITVNLDTKSIKSYSYVGSKSTTANSSKVATNVLRYANSDAVRVNDACKTLYYCEYHSTCYSNWYFTYTIHENSCACPSYPPSVAWDPNCISGGCNGNSWVKNNEITVKECDPGSIPDPGPGSPQVNPPAPPPIYPSNGLVVARLEIGQQNTITDIDNSNQGRRDRVYADVYIRFYSDITCTIPAVANASIPFSYTKYVTNIYWGGSYNTTNSYTASNTLSNTQIYLGNEMLSDINTFYDTSQGQITETLTTEIDMNGDPLYNLLNTYFF